MKRAIRFLWQYRLFSLAIITGIAALILQLTHHTTIAHWVLGVVAIFEVFPLLWGMFDDLRSGSYGIDILAATAIVASVALHQYWAALVVVIMLTGGESLEDYAEHRAKSELDTLLTHAPQTAHVIRNRKTIDVKVSEIHAGDKVIIRPGELVPVDAVILEGAASFNEASLTGESVPVAKDVNDYILSGSINLDGVITAKATATAKDSQYQQIIKLVRSAAASKAPFVRLADRYSIPFTFMAYAIAFAVWVVSHHAIRFLEVIIVATPCPLLLAAPIALISGMSRASRHGIIVKTGSALERLAEAETIAFDKTGTLTQGKLRVGAVTAYGKHTEADVLALAASLEQFSNHVVAQAIVTAAQDKKIKLTKAKQVQEISGRGLKATLKGKQILVGRLSLLKEHDVTIPAAVEKSQQKQTATYVSIGDELAGVITFTDELRKESKATIRHLHRLGVDNIMLVTGDNEASAQAAAKELGIDEVFAEALPADKLRVVESAAQRPIAFVGDGVNDAPVLTASDVGIALGASGSTAASESADMVIMLDDISRVAVALAIAKRTFQVARQSILAGIGLSFVLMLVFATGKFPPLLGAVLQEVVDVVVIFNALRAHAGKLPEINK